MSKTRNFDNILDECLERLLVRNETIEQCLKNFPEHADELKPLLETILATRKIITIQPRPEFKERARYQLQSVLREKALKKEPVSFRWRWQPQWATALAIILVVCLAGSGTVAAASGSMPDSPLYGIKQASEQVQLALTFSEIGKAELNAEMANTRVTEIVYLVDNNKPEEIARTTERLNTNLTEISAFAATPEMVSNVVTAPAAAPVPPPMPGAEVAPNRVPATTFKESSTPAPTDTHSQTIAAGGATSPPQAPAAQITPTTTQTSDQAVPANTQTSAGKIQATANQTLTAQTTANANIQVPVAKTVPAPSAAVKTAPISPSVAERANNAKPQEESAIKATSASGESGKNNKKISAEADQRAKLKIAVEGQASNNIARLRAVLETAPESTKPAIQQALNLSETGYEIAIEALK